MNFFGNDSTLHIILLRGGIVSLKRHLHRLPPTDMNMEWSDKLWCKHTQSHWENSWSHAVLSDPADKQIYQQHGHSLLCVLTMLHNAASWIITTKTNWQKANSNCSKRLIESVWITISSQYHFVTNTLIAFLTYLAFSFSKSWCDRIGFFNSSSTTIPGPLWCQIQIVISSVITEH